MAGELTTRGLARGLGIVVSQGGALVAVGVASVRSKLTAITGAGSGNFSTTTVPYIYYRSLHKTNKALRDPWGVFWNGAVDSAMGNAAWEHGPASNQVKTIRAAIWTGITNPLLADQTGVTVRPITFTGIQTGARRIKDLTYATRTWSDFVAAGGAVSGDNKTVTIPSGWSVEHDGVVGLNLTAQQKYFYVVEDGVPGAAAGTPLQTVRAAITSPSVFFGDMSKNATAVVTTTAGKHLCEDPAWTSGNGVAGVSSVSGNVAMSAPIIVLGLDNTGTVRNVAIDGDSIGDEKQDSIRDADGLAHGLTRALNREGFSLFKTAAFSSSMLNQRTYGGNFYRLGLLEYATGGVVTNHGHNDQSSMGTDANMKSLVRWHDLALKAALPAGGKRVVRLTQTPTVIFATAQAGGSTTSVQLSSFASATTGIYVGYQIAMTTGTAAGQYGIITAYDGSTKTATVSPTNTWNVAVVAGNYVLNYPNVDPTTDTTYTLFNAYMLRTGAYAGIAFDQTIGDPDAVLDAYASFGATGGRWNDVLDTFDGTHDASPGAVKSAAYYTLAMLTAALTFGP